MEKYRAYSHGRKNVVKVGVERDWQFYRETGLNDFFFDILALKKIKTIYTIYVELIFQSLENLADFRPFFWFNSPPLFIEMPKVQSCVKSPIRILIEPACEQTTGKFPIPVSEPKHKK